MVLFLYRWCSYRGLAHVYSLNIFARIAYAIERLSHPGGAWGFPPYLKLSLVLCNRLVIWHVTRQCIFSNIDIYTHDPNLCLLGRHTGALRLHWIIVRCVQSPSYPCSVFEGTSHLKRYSVLQRSKLAPCCWSWLFFQTHPPLIGQLAPCDISRPIIDGFV